mmetsp:Transcript_13862/g.34861  ORF Transcript_13862/g.34861 Transcript_13862/m.34861 type:complete len:223 (-) Transcript_13862:628-1296(-)
MMLALAMNLIPSASAVHAISWNACITSSRGTRPLGSTIVLMYCGVMPRQRWSSLKRSRRWSSSMPARPPPPGSRAASSDICAARCRWRHHWCSAPKSAVARRGSSRQSVASAVEMSSPSWALVRHAENGTPVLPVSHSQKPACSAIRLCSCWSSRTKQPCVPTESSKLHMCRTLMRPSRALCITSSPRSFTKPGTRRWSAATITSTAAAQYVSFPVSRDTAQ